MASLDVRKVGDGLRSLNAALESPLAMEFSDHIVVIAVTESGCGA
jgi:hypothetical protein